MPISSLNTNASISGKTITVNENADTITGLKTFDRGAATAPFAVAQATAAKVANLDADKLDGIEGADLVKKDGTVAMTGTLDLGTPGKIKFPAAQSASADANTLDDYEEGTFTPTLQFGGASVGITYSTQDGRYTKIGNIYYFSIRIILTAKGSSTGNATIAGLPFSATDWSSAVYGVFPVDYVTGSVGVTTLPFVIPNSANSLLFMQAVRTALTDANFSNTSEIRVGGWARGV